MNTAVSHLPPFALRPRFKAEVPFGIDEIGTKIKGRLKERKDDVVGKVVGNMAVLSIPDEKKHFWSPQLTLGMDETDTQGVTMLRGMYGPSTSVWLAFVFTYGILGIVASFALIIGLSQYTMGQSSYALYIAFFSVLGICALYFISFSGQKIGGAQMEVLHGFVEESLHYPIISVAAES